MFRIPTSHPRYRALVVYPAQSIRRGQIAGIRKKGRVAREREAETDADCL